MHLSFNKETSLSSINIEESWRKRLIEEFEKPYMRELSAFLKAENVTGTDTNAADELHEKRMNALCVSGLRSF